MESFRESLMGGKRYTSAEKHVLENGLTVLALHDPAALNCYLRLVVRVGSLDEEDDEVGIAHFIEHCGFRGTKSHENGTLHKFVESLGSRFGADLNAKTGLSETIWMLNVPVSHTEPNAQDEQRLMDSIRVLGEWAHSIRFSDEDVEAERSVILEEYRMKRGSSQRVKDTYWKQVMPRIGARIPIGTVQSIKALRADQLKKFYRETYTMDRMGLVVVGNLTSIGELDGLFSRLRASDIFQPAHQTTIDQQGFNVRARKSFRLPLRSPLCCVIHEKELASTTVNIEIYRTLELANMSPFAFIRREITKRVLTSVLEARLREVALRPNSQTRQEEKSRDEKSCDTGPFVSAGVSCRLAFHDLPTECMSISGQCHRVEDGQDEYEQIKSVVDALLREMVRLSRFGLSDEEVEFAKQKWKPAFERKLRSSLSRDEICSEICEEYVQHLALHEYLPLINYEDEAQLAVNFLDRGVGGNCGDTREGETEVAVIRAQDVATMATELLSNLVDFSQSNEINTVIALQGQHCASVDDQQLLLLVRHCLTEHSSSATLKPWIFHSPLESKEQVEKALLAAVVNPEVQPRSPQDIHKRKWSSFHLAETDAICFVLSNGLTVCVKNTSDIHPRKVSFQAFALGGSSALTEIEDAAFNFLSPVLQASGVGLLDDLGLAKVESIYQSSVRFQQHWFHRGIGGSCASENLQVLLQMIVSWLRGMDKDDVSQRKKLDKQAFERHRRIVLDGLRNEDSSESPERAFAERVRSTMIGEAEPVLRPVTKEKLLQVSLEMLEDLYYDAFTRDPANEFTFVFSGDLLSSTPCTSGDEVDFNALGDIFELYLGTTMLPKTNIISARWPAPVQLPKTFELAFPTVEHRDLFHFETTVEEKGEDTDTISSEDHHEGAKAQLLFGHKVSHGWDPADELDTELDLRIACAVAQIRLLEHLRTEQSLIYTLNVEHSRNSLAPFAIIFTSMSCKSKHAESVLDCVFHEYERMSHDPDTVTSACSAVAKQLEEWHKKARMNNSYWLFWLLDAWKRARTLWPHIDSHEDVCAWVDANAKKIACPQTFSERVSSRLDKIHEIFSSRFQDRVVICMLRDEPRPSGNL